MNKRNLLIFVVLMTGVLLFGMSTDSEGEDILITQNAGCSADFSYTIIRKTSEIVMIKFKSVKPGGSGQYFWDFGDGSNSRDENPVHTFDISGTKEFVVKCRISSGGCSDETIQTLSFSEKKCSAQFTYEIIRSDNKSADVKFTVNEPVSGAKYKWSFGDGKGTRKSDPVHRYNFKGGGEYKVTLSVTAGSCRDEATRMIRLGEGEPEEPAETCSSAFTYKIISSDEKSAVVEFTAAMADADSYSWNFGDKSKSKDKKPVHIYVLTGTFTFTVTLEVKKGKCHDDHSESIIIPEPEIEDVTCSAAFTYEIISVITGQAIVNFSSSMQDASEYTWSFGDGKKSVDKNPVHVFSTTTQKAYQVTLEVKKGRCKDVIQETIELKEPEVVVDDVCSADFTFEMKQSQGTEEIVQFTSVMTDASSYTWDFGDGEKATEANPAHTYDISKLRTFTVILEVVKGKCKDRMSKEVIFPGEPEKKCTAKFSYDIIRQDKSRALVQFITESIDSSTQFFWNFGDNTTSTKRNPEHLFKLGSKQQFDVLLEVVKGDCSDKHLVSLDFSGDVCTAEFTVKITYNDGNWARVEVLCKETKPYADFTCNFGDGTVSKEWNPVHTYNISRKKKFVITLRVKSGECDEQVKQDISF
ncbi:MAG: PKD domain-containing protein [Spirochaetales bacterium]|nr:PKD domain-containing protein [Spirochaetales bacterium]